MFEVKEFQIGQLKGISPENISEHLKLYAGYVNFTNKTLSEIKERQNSIEKDSYVISELYRRFAFEWNGMRNHEIYFSLLSGTRTSPNEESSLHKAILKKWSDFATWQKEFTQLATTRGIGWAMLWYDKSSNELYHSFVDEQHLGQLQGATPVIALDMWEHSYVADYAPSGKKTYIEDFLANINWSVAEDHFDSLL